MLDLVLEVMLNLNIFETTNTWRSRVKWNYKSITLGYYKTRNEAQQIIDTFFECIKYINQEKK